MGTEQFEKWSFSMFSHRKIHAFGCNGNKKMTVSYLSSFIPGICCSGNPDFFTNSETQGGKIL